MTTAADHWRTALQSWRLPDHLLGAATQQIFTSPPALWRRARLAEARHGTGETRRLVADLLGDQGSLLDVGAGAGRISLPLAALGPALMCCDCPASVTPAEQTEPVPFCTTTLFCTPG